jgi:hypothetical protein
LELSESIRGCRSNAVIWIVGFVNQLWEMLNEDLLITVSTSIQFVIRLEVLLLCVFAIGALENELIVVSGSAEENDGYTTMFQGQHVFQFVHLY